MRIKLLESIGRPHVAVRAASAMLLAALLGCTGSERSSVSPPSSEFAAMDAWLGRWIGPEGTYLEIGGGHGRYQLTVADLDGPRSYEGEAQAAGIVFERDGAQAVIRATDGVGTGMKWLADESNCLVINPGEGFCRP